MTYLYQILMVLLLGTSAFGSEFSGLILTNSANGLIESSSRKVFSLTYAIPQIAKQVKKLKANDYISFDGTLDQVHQSISVQSVNFVGLKSLLGSWTGSDNFCYQFTDFTTLLIFRRESSDCRFDAPIRPSTKIMTYFVNPTSQGWITLISDSTGSYAAELTVKSAARVEIGLYDSNSGDILKKVILKK